MENLYKETEDLPQYYKLPIPISLHPVGVNLAEFIV